MLQEPLDGRVRWRPGQGHPPARVYGIRVAGRLSDEFVQKGVPRPRVEREKFAIGANEFASTLSAVTGWNYTADDILKTGERIYNLERAFNIREGTHWQDEIPKRFLEDPMPEGPKKGQVLRLDEMLGEYYNLRGWVEGKPTKAKLKELGLDQAAKDVGV